jgi:hypothetical protein
MLVVSSFVLDDGLRIHIIRAVILHCETSLLQTARTQATSYTTALFAGIYFPRVFTRITLYMTTPEKTTITLDHFGNDLNIVPPSTAQDTTTISTRRGDITNTA